MIKKAEKHHLQDILTIERACFERPWSEIHFLSDLENPLAASNWVYMSEKQLQGYLFGWYIEGEYHLNNLAVDPLFQHQGIGKKLLDFVLDMLDKDHAEKIFLEVSAGNTAARKLYESRGFTPIGARKDYYTKGDDAIVYVREFE